MSCNPAAANRRIKSYVLRQGRITPAQKKALTEYLQRYAIRAGASPLDLNEIFGRSAPRVLEIGAGGGEFTLCEAALHPENDYLAAEVHAPGIGRLLQGIAAGGLTNIRVIDQDVVVALQGLIPEDALDQAMIFFPDPWPKQRHHKRRLINREFLDLLVTRMRAHGRLYLATDWQELAEEIRTLGDAHPRLWNLAGPGYFAPRPAWRPETRFERRGKRLGHEVYDLVYCLR